MDNINSLHLLLYLCSKNSIFALLTDELNCSRMKREIAYIVAGMMLLACSPKVTTNFSSAWDSLPEDAYVAILGPESPEPENAEALGTISIGDTGFTTTRNGSYEAVLAIARDRARWAGGNVVKIDKHKTPDLICSTHRIEARILRVSDAKSLDFKISNPTPSHPDCVIIYFYRPPSSIGSLVSYDVNIGEAAVFRAKNKSKAEVKVYEEGVLNIWARTESRAEINLPVKLGEEYYIRCTVTMGMMTGHPLLEAVVPDMGRSESESIK